MAMEDVKEFINEITDHLKKGYSLSKTEKELNLTKNDIQRYFNRYSDTNYQELKNIGRQYLKENKKTKRTKALINDSESDIISKEILKLKKRVTALENKALVKHEDFEINDLDFKEHFQNSKKTLSNFRLTSENRKKLSSEAKKLLISQNELINYLIWKL